MEHLKLKRSATAPEPALRNSSTKTRTRKEKTKDKDKDKSKKTREKKKHKRNDTNGKEKEKPKPPPIPHKPPEIKLLHNANAQGKENKSLNSKNACSINENSKHATLWGSDGENLPSVFHAWIKLGISGDSLRASEWGGFTTKDKEVAIRVAPSGEGPLMLIEEDGVILFKSEPRFLREVADSSRYFSLKVPKSQIHPEDFYIGIAFNDRKDSGAFVRKLWSILRESSHNGSRGPSTPIRTEDPGEEDKSSFWLFMSDEIALNIFRYLGHKDLCRLSETCSRWNLIANDRFLWKELCTKHRFKPDEQELKYKYHKSYKVCFIQNWRVLHPPKVGAHAPDEEDLLKYTKRIQFQGTASIKLVCVGSCGSEKTKLLLAYAQRGSISQGDEYIPTVFDNYTIHMKSEALPILADDSSVELSLWDTAGQDEYDRLRPLSYANASVFLVLFSLVNPQSFANVRNKWYPEIQHFCPNVPMVLVGVQAELRSDTATLQNLQASGQSPISTSDALKEASYLMFDHYIECSIPTGENIEKVFQLAVYAVLIRQQRKQKDKGKCLVC